VGFPERRGAAEVQNLYRGRALLDHFREPAETLPAVL
jgi:hypothetical protein